MSLKYTSSILIIITTLGMTSICFASSREQSITNAGNTVLQGAKEAYNDVKGPSGGAKKDTIGNPLTITQTMEEAEDALEHIAEDALKHIAEEGLEHIVLEFVAGI